MEEHGLVPQARNGEGEAAEVEGGGEDLVLVGGEGGAQGDMVEQGGEDQED